MFLRFALIVGLPTILESFPLRSSCHAVSTSTHPKEPITSPSPRVPPGPEEEFEAETKSDTASVPPEAPEPVSLWDEAYDLLKIEKPDLLSDYESLLSRVAAEAHRQKLQQIAQLSFEKMQEGKLHATFFGKKIVLQEAIGTLGNGMNWVQTYAKDALKDEQVKGLYKLVIDYQVQSVMRFDRNPVKNYFRSVTDYDAWSNQLNTIKEEEKTLKMRFQVALSGLSVQKLNDLELEAGKSRETLTVVANLTRKIEKHLSDAEYRRCLNTLKATDPQLDKQRIEKLKGGLLKDSYKWVIENQEFKRWMDASSGELLWIKGDPGKGKTMLLCGIIDELSQLAAPGTNIAFFFCQASVETLDNYPAVLRGLISMLVKQQPSLMSHLSEASFDGHNAWLALQNTLTNILKDPTLQPTYLLIDGLDECVRDRQNLLDLLIEHSSAHENIKWIVSSRNWPGIEEDLHLAKKIKLHLELNEAVLSKAIQSFIEYRVQKLENRSNGSKGKTDIWNAVKDHLVENANGTFLWVALVCEHLAKMFYWEVREKLKDFPPHLEKIYERMMSQIIDSDKSEICKSILGVTTTVLRPITQDEMMVYVDIPGDDARALEDLVGLCGSFLSVQENTIFLIHQSAKDFIMGTASSKIFPHGKDMVHYDIFSRSLHILQENLRRDIYNLRVPGYPIQEVPIQNPDPLRAVRYACVYWVDHVVSCGNIEDIKKAIAEEGLVDSFIQQSYLHWLEAMSILKSIPSGISSMQKLERFIQKWMNAEPKSLVHRVRDAIRFVQYTKVAIESSPLQVYYSSLIYSPMQSITRECYDDRQSIRDWIRKEPVVESCWSPCLQTLEGHTDGVCSLAWSRDGSRLASGALSSARIWDLDTCECSFRWVHCLAWSPDGSRLAAGSLYATVNIWDIQTRDYVLLKGHTSHITSVAWSSDGSRLASGSKDRTIRIWDVCAKDCVFILEGHNGSRLASGSEDKTIKIWDITGQFKSITRGHDDILESITWSHDGVQLVSLARDRIVRVWNPTTRGQLSTFQGRPSIVDWDADHIRKLVWSPDGNQLAAGLGDGVILVWNPISGDQLSICSGHTHRIEDIAWSPDGSQLASASCEGTVRVWNLTTGDQLSICNGPNKVAWSPDGRQLASGSIDGTIQVWNPTTGDRLSISTDYINWIEDIAWSPDGSQLASVVSNGAVRVWDLTTDNDYRDCDDDTDYDSKVAWSPDGNQLASLSHSKVVVLDPTSGQCISNFPVATDGLLRFDSIDPNYLHMRLGTFDMRGLKRASRGSNDSNHIPKPHGYGLSEDLSWITYDGTKVLWLPPDHRPQTLSAVALSNLAVAIGCASGAVEVLEFSTLNPLSDL
ncbi:WD40-repeat-containing domain protein [Aspergillus transmontanensis]|uniref:WD40-repeat-containing domain protein n=1 Tax=Aspergillus transmontanensis TaxID=1034304 RepID=A0A5N6VJC2_9EURO|nr:WD40-repeat-containing domain protein [Aspergillus transmontanensis]